MVMMRMMTMMSFRLILTSFTSIIPSNTVNANYPAPPRTTCQKYRTSTIR